MLYQIISSKKYDNLKTIKIGESITENLKTELDSRYNYKLRIRGQVGVPYVYRTEGAFPMYYRKLEDSLTLEKDEYVLNFDETNQVYERSLYYMLTDELAVNVPYEFKLNAKAKGINGNFKASIEVYYGEKKTRYYYEQPDCTYAIDLYDSEDYVEHVQKLVFEKPVDFLMIKISALDFDGKATIKAPIVCGNGKTHVEKFDYNPKLLGKQKWIGEGFSLTERPYFTVSVNGKQIFSGNKTDRLQCLTNVEFEIPQGILTGDDQFVITYGAVNKIDYEYNEVQLVTLPKQTEILGVQANQVLNTPFGVLCHFDKDCTLSVLADGFKVESDLNVKKGYGVVKFIPEQLGVKTITISDGEVIRTATVTVTDKKADGVITGSGDFIYINQNWNDFIEYIAWYVNESIGDMLTFRSCYRWGGTAEIDRDFWKKAVSIVKDLGIYYVLMLDGRELNGANANPPVDILQSEYFLGEQTHEKDGSFTYWVQDLDEHEAFFNHLFSRKLERNGIQGKFSPVYNKKKEPRWFYAGDDIYNMKDAYEQFVYHLSRTNADGATRHTGVTPMFDAFFKAGYKWVGYESMYGSHELIFGAIRGMSNSNNQPCFGSHGALQWSTVPCDVEGHALRYRLSLYESYMQGASHINTEEGLWRIETPLADHDRYSYACTIHKNEQQMFNRFVKSHTRRGKQIRKIAMMVGKYDGMDCFSTGRVYGQYGEYWKYNVPEYSWDLLKEFYPQATIGQVYVFVIKGGEASLRPRDVEFLTYGPDPYEQVLDEQSLGFYSSTPYGVIDLIAYDAKNLSDYDFIFLTGWNTCSVEQLTALCKFMDNGGTVMLARAHLSDSVSREEVLTGKAEVMKHSIVDKFLSYKDNLIYFDREGFPIEFKDDYAKALREAGEKFGSKYVKKADHITFTEYECENGSRNVYAVNIRWWDKVPATCRLELNDATYDIELTDNLLKMLSISPDATKAVLVEDYALDVGEITNQYVVIKGFSKATIKLYFGGQVRLIDLDVDGEQKVYFGI